ncbi:MAG TPA: 2-phospho-L-lactate guanylyltransferase [Dehalococcoidia bacterium]|nr:2-phospho-L-lactate guanylyltransferase [Dehalococcoidia bacterium]
MSGCWAIIPVKALDDAKSRLAEALAPRERVFLSLEMLERVLAAVMEAEELAPLVVSRDNRALELARASGVETLLDRRQGLNPSVEEAARWALGKGASGLLVVHADLPLLRRDDISAILKLGAGTPSVVLAPCRREEGTNALFMRPPGLIPFAFGPGSFKAHAALACRRGAFLRIYRSPRTALDVDTVGDLETFRAQVPLVARSSP